MAAETNRGRVPTLLALVVLSAVHLASLLFWAVSLLLLLASFTPLDQPWVYLAMAIYAVSLVVSQPKAWKRYRDGRYGAVLGWALLPLATGLVALVAYAIIWPR